MYYDKQIETAKTPLELGQYLDLEMEEYSIGSGGVAIDPNTLTLAARSAIGICRDNPHLIFEDVPEDIVRLQNWCIKSQRVIDGKVSATGEIDTETSEQKDAEKPAEIEQENEPQEKDGQSNGGKVDSPNEKSSYSLFWRHHWKWIIGTSIALIGTSIALIAFIWSIMNT